MFGPQGYESVFWVCALLGTAFFLIRVVLGGFGMEAHHHDGVVDGNVDYTHDAQGTFDSFKIFSLYSLAAFIMMFGWVGLAATKELQLGSGASTLLGVVFGFGTMVLTAYFFHTAKKLETTGTVFSVAALKGKMAKVYQNIPADGRGVIHVSQDGQLREIEAVSIDKQAIASFSEVQIVDAHGNNVAVVKKL